jgi:hypothetical protein
MSRSLASRWQSFSAILLAVSIAGTPSFPLLFDSLSFCLHPFSLLSLCSPRLLSHLSLGTPYAFGIFSEIFKKELQFRQLDLSVIASCGSTGLYTGVFSGMALEQIGPRNLLVIGGIAVLSGNLYIWFAVQKMIWATVPAISLAYFLAQIGISCTTMTATALSIGIFPSEVTGQVAGLSKAYFGISSAVLATISAGFFESTSTDFILFVALFIPFVLFSAAMNV